LNTVRVSLNAACVTLIAVRVSLLCNVCTIALQRVNDCFATGERLLCSVCTFALQLDFVSLKR